MLLRINLNLLQKKFPQIEQGIGTIQSVYIW